MPWRNGRGRTAEIAVSGDPEGEFRWRVSMAEVAEDGAFSEFPGIDRVLTVIAGAGLTLEIDGRPVALDDEPVAFPGDVPCAARLGAGPITDLNVMTRRGACRAVVRRDGRGSLPGATDRLVFALGPTEVAAPGRVVALAARDTLHLTGAEASGIEPAGAWLDIQIVAAGESE